MTMWSGHFPGSMDPDAWNLNASLSVDKRLFKQDIEASLAWAKQLHLINIIPEDEYKAICEGLKQIQIEMSDQSFVFQPDDEDIHTAVERRLVEHVGPCAGKLHTGRSRNDQVATDFRLWLMENVHHLINEIRLFQRTLVGLAERDMDIILPAYTHLQRAQPILLSHWWLSFFWPLERDCQRLIFNFNQAGVLPLGSGAVAGTGFPVDRKTLADDLGFAQISQNSIDAVSDRDFAAQFLFDTALCGVHLSRLAEQVVLFSTAEFSFFTLDHAFATGSSLMPQKKNPDVFELTRGKTGSLLGSLISLLATLKGLPSTYDKDLQEDKQTVFSSFDTLMSIFPVLTKAIAAIEFNRVKMAAAVEPSVFATDIADALVKEGIPFREAHALVGRAVRKADELGLELNQLQQDDWKKLLPDVDMNWQQYFSAELSIAARSVAGGTAPSAVLDQIEIARRIIYQ